MGWGKKIKVVTILFIVLLSINTQANAASKSKVAKPIVLAYTTGDTGNALQSLHRYVTQISTDTFDFDTAGQIGGAIPTSTVSYANSVGLISYAVVSNYGATGFDTNLAHLAMTDSTIENNLIRNMLTLVQTGHYKGINIDFESVSPSDRSALSLFVQKVASAMHRRGFLTMVSVPAKSTDDPSDSWSGAYDFKALGTYADIVQLMTYDENGVWSTPGSVGGSGWISDSIKFAVSEIPCKKLLMGLAEYGNDWNLSDPTNNSNHVVMWKDIPALVSSTRAIPRRDAATDSMYFYYTKAGQKHVVWYEDAASIRAKAHYTIKYRLAGISCYSMGDENENFWVAVNAGLNP